MSWQLEVVVHAVANGNPVSIEASIREAYRSGATTAQVHLAVEMGHCLTRLPPSARNFALASVDMRRWPVPGTGPV
jgi:hypothetical protein